MYVYIYVCLIDIYIYICIYIYIYINVLNTFLLIDISTSKLILLQKLEKHTDGN